MAIYNLRVNGKKHEVEVEEDTPLLWVLRDHLGLVGTKYSCGIAQCGACMVHINGETVISCVMPVSNIGEDEVTTIEGLSINGDHPVQRAWDEVDVAQCGYCQAGQIMSAAALLKKNPSPSDQEIENGMNRNICRCGTYHKIREAVALASKIK
ncbi:(2Fe-2S)-binding protein [Anditalea andensis]|uniref:(2Fe-2S)-binding protein n=1 Tax=Anditalea andensis TaxID=1048983 RepID=A0A074L0I0_9BACT|nr:(2Fe-2S)-binding protein [Anditalea andensis]KEO73990.1 (2Fe-2S)-binding protein [Anditalea andensis]